MINNFTNIVYEGRKIEVGPILPKKGIRTIFALDSDESTMNCAEKDLSQNDRDADKQYVEDNSAFTLSAIVLSKPDDIFILDSEYLKSENILNIYYNLWKKIGLKFSENIHFSPPKEFALCAKNILKKEKDVDLISITCYSYNLLKYFNLEDTLEVSKKLNSKMYLQKLSLKYDFDIPDSFTLNLDDLSANDISNLNFLGNEFYIKGDGLGGGGNVWKIKNINEFKQVVESNKLRGKVIIQKALDENFLEVGHSSVVYDTHTEYRNTRLKLVSGTAWYGSVYLKDFTISDSQKAAYERASIAMQKEGYVNKYGMKVGFNSFINRVSNSLKIIEINARWEGSVPSEELLIREGILGRKDAVFYFDYIDLEDFESYIKFLTQNLYSKKVSRKFSLIPMAFSGYTNQGKRLVCHIVVGSFVMYSKKVRETFQLKSFTMLEETIKTIQNIKNKYKK